MSISYNIAAFGCWNNPRNKPENGPAYLNLVLESLKYFQRNYTDLIILGDNYYPEKDKETKIKKTIYNESELSEPFDKIKALLIPNKYLIMGNHDVADFMECDGLKYQLTLKDKINVEFPFGSKVVDINGFKYKYIFIDTNLYEPKLNDKFPCFQSTLNKTNIELFNEQNDFLIKQLSEDDIHHFLIFGHEPIFSLKTKNDETKGKYNKISTLDKLAEIIFDNMKQNNVTYICADVHMYQEGKIINLNNDKYMHKYINQIVVGTGGAELDNCDQCDFKIYNNNNLYYKLKNGDISFGYLNIKLDGSMVLQYDYIMLGLDDNIKKSIQNGGRYKYTTYKLNYWL